VSLVTDGYEPLIGAQAELVAHQTRRHRLQALLARNLLAELAAARAATVEAKQEADAVREQLDATRAENEVLRDEVRAARDDVEEAKAHSEEAKFERDAARDEADAAKDEADAARAEADEARALLKTEQARYESSVQSLEAALAQRESDMRALEADMAARGSQPTALESELESELWAAKQRVEELDQLLRQEREAARDEADAVKDEADTARADLDAARAEADEAHALLKTEQVRYESSVRSLEAALAQRESDMRALEADMASQSTGLGSDLESELRAARQRADELDQLLGREQASRDRQAVQFEEELHATRAARRTAETELSTVRESMVQERERHEGERARLESALSGLRSESADREGEQDMTDLWASVHANGCVARTVRLAKLARAKAGLKEDILGLNLALEAKQQECVRPAVCAEEPALRLTLWGRTDSRCSNAKFAGDHRRCWATGPPVRRSCQRRGRGGQRLIGPRGRR
jgi:chromosome segregation ATPase